MTSRVEELQRMCDNINENGGLDSGEWHTALLAQIAQNLAVIADVMLADRKTEPQTDCYMCKWLGEVDVCGRCRNRNLFAEANTEPKPKDEPQTEICFYCEHYEPKGYCTLKECSVSPNHKCDKHLVVEPYEYEIKALHKDYIEPYVIIEDEQTDTEIAKAVVHKMIDDAVIAEDAYPDLRQKMHDAVDEYEPQTEDEILREQCRAFMGIVEQTERNG